MCTPVGHSLIGLALGLAVGLPRAAVFAFKRNVVAYRWPILLAVLLANTPDLDYLPGLLRGDLNAYHHGYTHTLGWTFLVGVGVWLLFRHRVPLTGARWCVLIFAALTSHLVADVLTADGAAPYGIMALWPMTDTYLISPHTIFLAPHKDTLSTLWQWHNFKVMLVDAAWAGVFVMAVLGWKVLPRRTC